MQSNKNKIPWAYRMVAIGMLVIMSHTLLKFFINRALPDENSNSNNIELLEAHEKIYDSIFNNKNFVEYWESPIWKNENKNKLPNNLLFWFRYRGAYTTTDVNLRTSPIIKNSEIINVIPKGTFVVSQWATRNPNPYNEWFEIGALNHRGWINGKFLRPSNSNERNQQMDKLTNQMFSFVLDGDTKNERIINFLKQFLIPIMLLTIKRLMNYTKGLNLGKLVITYFDMASWGFILLYHVFSNLNFILYEMVPHEYLLYFLFISLSSLMLGLIIDLIIEIPFLMFKKT